MGREVQRQLWNEYPTQEQRNREMPQKCILKIFTYIHNLGIHINNHERVKNRLLAPIIVKCHQLQAEFLELFLMTLYKEYKYSADVPGESEHLTGMSDRWF